LYVIKEYFKNEGFFFLKSLKFHLRDRCKDIGFIEFFKDENNCFITIEDYVLESFVILSNILSQKRIVFSCGIKKIRETVYVGCVELIVSMLSCFRAVLFRMIPKKEKQEMMV